MRHAVRVVPVQIYMLRVRHCTLPSISAIFYSIKGWLDLLCDLVSNVSATPAIFRRKAGCYAVLLLRHRLALSMRADRRKPQDGAAAA